MKQRAMKDGGETDSSESTFAGESCVVIAPVIGAVKKLAPHRIFEKTPVRFSLGDERF